MRVKESHSQYCFIFVKQEWQIYRLTSSGISTWLELTHGSATHGCMQNVPCINGGYNPLKNIANHPQILRKIIQNLWNQQPAWVINHPQILRKKFNMFQTSNPLKNIVSFETNNQLCWWTHGVAPQKIAHGFDLSGHRARLRCPWSRWQSAYQFQSHPGAGAAVWRLVGTITTNEWLMMAINQHGRILSIRCEPSSKHQLAIEFANELQ